MPPALREIEGQEGIGSVQCIDALMGAMVDVFCVIRCNDSTVCDSLVHRMADNFGDFQRGPTILVHSQCGVDPVSGATNCKEARRALGVVGER
jgi:hypothetical protein